MSRFRTSDLQGIAHAQEQESRQANAGVLSRISIVAEFRISVVAAGVHINPKRSRAPNSGQEEAATG